MIGQRLLTALLLASVCLPSKTLAKLHPTQTSQGPLATATGNVTNQASPSVSGSLCDNFLWLRCGLSRNHHECIHLCHGKQQLQLGSRSYLTGSRNAGITLGVGVPLDGGAVELCKERARTEIARQQAEADKARLDFELVRLLKCGEAMSSGVRFHPNSPYAGICADVVVVNPHTTSTSSSS